ncbi:50S ribosomal protein L24e [Halomarina rubra]|uniref:Large ribosomal subunit protein eL24 n=1 Tax=Halomarina rubra TaxID=2071873 RepID=A0ABD6B0K2_9EURY|nr:50S ribosomal protein L24e [Halomarina rubra]
MPANRTCDYTGEEIEPGTGVMYVKNDGSVLHFVNSKAEKNYLMGREARDLEWTEAGRRARAANRPTEDADTVADEGSTEMDEPEPTSDVAEPDEEEVRADASEGVEADTPDEEARGDEDEEPVEDVGGGKEADGVEDADNAPDLESAEAEASEEEDDQ